MSPPLTERVRDAVSAVRERCALRPQVGMILGTGLGRLAERIEVDEGIPYGEIPGFATSTVVSHAGRFLLGRLGGKPVVAMQGRFHRYEGYTLEEVTFPVRVMRALGAGVLVVSNASGGLDPQWEAGDLVLLDDHVNLMGDNPLVGENPDELGPRFPDMSEPYDRELQRLARELAVEQGTTLHRGVYAAVAGPNLETRAEYRMLRAIGADLVGMSTVPEVIVAVHGGMRVLGISVITNACRPDLVQPADVQEIIAIAASAEPRLTALVEGIVARLP